VQRPLPQPAMPKLFTLLALAFLLAITSTTNAQTLADIQRYSQYSPTGTARSLAMGNAFNAIGADFSSTFINPAGLGLYRSSEIMLSTGVQVFNTRSTFNGDVSKASTTRFYVPNLGIVIQAATPKAGALKSITFAIGYNQVEQYRRRIDASTFNNRNSITNFFAQQADGDNLFDGRRVASGPLDYPFFAFNTFFRDVSSGGDTLEVGLINPVVDSPNRYFGAFNEGGIEQRIERLEKGRMNDWNFSAGANFSDRIFIGASLGIRSINYEMNSTITERDVAGNYNTFAVDRRRLLAVEFGEKVVTTGTQYNFKIGVIAQPVDFLRLGISAETGSAFSLTDTYNTSYGIQARDGVWSKANPIDDGSYNYRITTPWNVNAGLAIIAGKKGIISGQFNLRDYSSASISDVPGNNQSTQYFRELNSQVLQQQQLAYGVNFGGEYRMEDVYLRLGFGYESSMRNNNGLNYTPDLNANTTRQSPFQGEILQFSGGIGYRTRDFYIDLAYMRQERYDILPLYTLNVNQALEYRPTDPVIYLTPTVLARRVLTNVVMTFGITLGRSK
jgi:hypothetical protein